MQTIIRIEDGRPTALMAGDIPSLCCYLLHCGDQAAATRIAQLKTWKAGEFLWLGECWFFGSNEDGEFDDADSKDVD